nr:Arm DNA-binding domain-containing protein [Rhizobacter sp. Root16D2]
MAFASKPLKLDALGPAWTYRYRSPVDGRMRQVGLGRWRAMSFPAAAIEWERLREERDAGGDPALSKRQTREAERSARAAAKQEQQERGYTVRILCEDYLVGHVDRARKPKGAIEVRRMFDTMLSPLDEASASTLTRRQCFDLLESLQHIPVQAAKLRAELGAAWDYALDAGRIPDSTPNWWRQIMRGRRPARRARSLRCRGVKDAARSGARSVAIDGGAGRS